MFQFNAKFDADPFLYSLSNFDCDGHTVHMLAELAPTDWYSEIIIVYTCAFQSTLLGCQVTSVLRKPFCLY